MCLVTSISIDHSTGLGTVTRIMKHACMAYVLLALFVLHTACTEACSITYDKKALQPRPSLATNENKLELCANPTAPYNTFNPIYLSVPSHALTGLHLSLQFVSQFAGTSLSRLAQPALRGKETHTRDQDIN